MRFQLMLARHRGRLGHESVGILRAQHAHQSAEHLAHDRKRDLGPVVGAAAGQLREVREVQALPLLAMDPVQGRRLGFGAAQVAVQQCPLFRAEALRQGGMARTTGYAAIPVS